jgi:DNA-directed RNA polymerase specialized sigma24 family protein
VTSWRALLETARNDYEGIAYELSAAMSAKAIAEFVACFKAEFNRLVIVLLRQGIPYHDATDAAQTAFTEAFRQWEQIRSPRAWLRRVAIRCIKHLLEDPVQDMSVADHHSFQTASTPPVSNLELDAILQAADADLASSLERVTDTAAGAHAIVGRTCAEAMRIHPAGYRNLADGA